MVHADVLNVNAHVAVAYFKILKTVGVSSRNLLSGSSVTLYVFGVPIVNAVFRNGRDENFNRRFVIRRRAAVNLSYSARTLFKVEIAFLSFHPCSVFVHFGEFIVRRRAFESERSRIRARIISESIDKPVVIIPRGSITERSSLHNAEMHGGRGYAEYVILRHKVFIVRKSNGLCRRKGVYVATPRFVAAELYRNSARPSVRYFTVLFRLPVSARKSVDRYIVFNDGNFIRCGARRNHARRKHCCRS